MSDEAPIDGEALVRALRGPSPTYKREAVEAVVANAEHTVPHLMAILQEVLHDPDGYIKQMGEDFDALYALATIAHLRVSEAHPLLIELCRLSEEQFESIFGGFLTEGMDLALFATCDGDTALIRELTLDRRAGGFLRSSGAEALVLAAHHGWAQRDEVLDFLAALLVPEACPLGDYFWTGTTIAMMDLWPVEHRGAIERALDGGLVLSGVFNSYDLDEMLALGPEERARELSQHVEAALSPDPHSWLSEWACFGTPGSRARYPGGEELLMLPDAPQRLSDAVREPITREPQAVTARKKSKRKQQKASRKKNQRPKKKKRRKK